MRSHPSYLQGRSAPATPGILSRSSSRRHLHDGLSRRGSLYDNEAPQDISYEYSDAVLEDAAGRLRREAGSGQIPKAKSEAALLVQRSKLAGQGVQLKRHIQHRHGRSSTGGTTTPKAKTRSRNLEDDWLTRTGATANAILQESKGQSWLATRPSGTSLTHLQDTTDEEDEGYEEMAAMAAKSSRQQLGEDELSPVSTRASRWGSKYGSRQASRRTSRRGSVTGESRTPLAPGGQDGAADNFDEDILSPTEPQFVGLSEEGEESEELDEAAAARLAENRSFGLGGIVDRLMNFNLFKVEEREESTEDEVEHASETEEEAKIRMAAENKRKREEKEKLVGPPVPQEGNDGAAQGEGGWSDAAWLLSVATKVMF